MTALERLKGQLELFIEISGINRNRATLLRSALKAVEDEQRWVPVEERLPNDYSEVLISVTTSEGNSKVLSGGIGLRDDGQRVWCFLWERPIPITDENVTHWRPMPEGPWGGDEMSEMKHAQEWSKEAIWELLRFGRKHTGPWEECSGDIPEEKDAELIVAASEMLEILKLWKKLVEVEEDELSAVELVQYVREYTEAVERTEKVLKKVRDEK